MSEEEGVAQTLAVVCPRDDNPTPVGRWAGLYTYPHNDAHRGRRTDGESDFLIRRSDKDGKAIYKGDGHDIIGPFQILDVHFSEEEGKITFRKQYKTHSWPYKGSIDRASNIMHGAWGPDNLGAWGYFAFLLGNNNERDEFESTKKLHSFVGNWSGTYSKRKNGYPDKIRDCTFTLHCETSEGAALLTITGHGESATGKYEIKGVVSPENQVAFAKIVGGYTYLYRGEMKWRNMHGHWVGEGSSGTFNFDHEHIDEEPSGHVFY